MGFVAGVCAAMDGQRAALDKSFLAWLVVARVWALVGVDAIVSLEI